MYAKQKTDDITFYRAVRDDFERWVLKGGEDDNKTSFSR